jgi:putative endonuclease
MYYTYVLHSKKDNGLYIGYTKDLKTRIKQHQDGKSISTKNRLPLSLVYYESFIMDSGARAREKYLKSGYGREQLKGILKNLFNKFI